MTDAPHRVLVADGERFFREAIAEALREAGIACVEVETAAEALRLAAREPRMAVALVDLALENGPALVERLRREQPKIRVIALATATDQDRVLEALRAGAVDYLAKPLHDEELVLAVRRALGAFATEDRLERLRVRIQSLDAWHAELAEAARGGDDARFDAAAAEAVADVLGATKTSLMILDATSQNLHVVGAVGASVPLEEMAAVPLGEGIAGAVAAQDDVLILADVGSDPRFAARPFRKRYEAGALAVAPLRDGARVLGVLCATDREGGAPFGDDEGTLLRMLAAHVTALLARGGAAATAPVPGPEAARAPAQAAATASDRIDRDAELAREICEAIAVEVEPERLLATALQAVARRLAASPVSLYLIDREGGDLALEGLFDVEGRVDRRRLPRDRGLTAQALQAGHLVATARPQADPRFDAAVDTPEDGSTGPFLCIPLRLRGKIVGVARAFPKDAALASARTGEILAAALSAAVRNLLLYRSLLDSIEDLARARREAGPRD
jgi:DNA-binding NarL/FixJ family response regulator